MSDPNLNAGRGSKTASFFFVFFFLLPVLAAIALYQLHPFEPAPFPLHELVGSPLTAPLINDHVLSGAEFVGSGQLDAPEDIVYDRDSGLIYTGCADGWVKRVDVNKAASSAAADGDSVVENWFNTGGRPLGIAIGRHAEIIVADANKGLLNISRDGKTMELLTDEAEGVQFKLTDAVDIAEDGVLYFTDASSKYSMADFKYDLFEGNPHGRLLSYDPATGITQILLTDLYFPNGVVVSPDQTHLVFCETFMRRCRKYYIQGEKTGQVEKFLEPLPGFPDNIRIDEQGHYWIALSSSITTQWDLALRYPLVRKASAIMAQYGFSLEHTSNAGAFQVDREGKPIAHYSDFGLSLISTGIKIGKHLYFGSIHYPHIVRLNLDEHPARSAA